MAPKRKLLIVTLNDYLIYQPTILNLYDSLVDDFDPVIVSFSPASLNREKESSRRVIYIDVNKFTRLILQKADFLFFHMWRWIQKVFRIHPYRFIYYNWYLPRLLTSRLQSEVADIIIAVDIPALKVCQEIYGKVHFLSLEIDANSPALRKIDRGLVSSVFVQNKERFRFLFGDSQVPQFIVQNAPVFNAPPVVESKTEAFIWAGSILTRFAVLDCINFFDAHRNYALVLKGGSDGKTLRIIRNRFGHLLKDGIIKIDTDYIPGDRFLNYLAKFKIGFCFYSWELIRDDFNYQTAPSGKLFMYLAAGVPVIASNIPGFQLLKEYGAGVLVDDYEPESILRAVQIIEKDYRSFSENCLAAARHFSFDRMVKPYVEFLKNA